MKRRIVFIILITPLLIIAQPQQKALEKYNEGEKYFQNNDFDKALDSYNEAIILDPNYAEAYYRFGRVLIDFAKSYETLNSFWERNRDKKLNSIFPNIAEKYTPYEASKKVASLYLNKALELNDQLADAWLLLGKTDNNLQYFFTAIQIYPDYDYAYYSRGNFYQENRCYKLAIDDYTKNIQLTKDKEYICFSNLRIAECLITFPDIKPVLEIINKIKKINSKFNFDSDYLIHNIATCFSDPNACKKIYELNDLLRCAEILERNEMPFEAEEYYNLASKIVIPKTKSKSDNEVNLCNHLAALVKLGAFYVRLLNWDEAIKNFNSTIQLKDQVNYSLSENYIAKAYFLRGVSRNQIRDFKNALVDFTLADKMDYTLSYSDFDNFYYQISVALFNIGQYERAHENIKKTSFLIPSQTTKKVKAVDQYPFVKYISGRINLALKNYKEAINDLNIDPGNYENADSVHFYRGISRIQLKDYSNAIKDFKKAIGITPNMSCAFFYQGVAEAEMKNQNNACTLVKKAKELGYPRADEWLNKYCK